VVLLFATRTRRSTADRRRECPFHEPPGALRADRECPAASGRLKQEQPPGGRLGDKAEHTPGALGDNPRARIWAAAAARRCGTTLLLRWAAAPAVRLLEARPCGPSKHHVVSALTAASPDGATPALANLASGLRPWVASTSAPPGECSSPAFGPRRWFSSNAMTSVPPRPAPARLAMHNARRRRQRAGACSVSG
jgi:hypothetical protein